jgi:hypothetical protein
MELELHLVEKQAVTEDPTELGPGSFKSATPSGRQSIAGIAFPC